VVAALCLLAPTLLMGASLPAMARWIQTTREGVSWLGFFYAATSRARSLDACWPDSIYCVSTIWRPPLNVAVLINVAVGVGGLLLATESEYDLPRRTKRFPSCERREPGESSPRSRFPECALWAQKWSGPVLLAVMMGATVYTFSIILAVFLVGLGIGSSVGSLIARAD